VDRTVIALAEGGLVVVAKGLRTTIRRIEWPDVASSITVKRPRSGVAEAVVDGLRIPLTAADAEDLAATISDGFLQHLRTGYEFF
jgi:hypothetical protein